MDIRKKIITGAGELFVKHGTRQVTMDTIAHALGISKRTIYENFKDKNDLLINFLTITIHNHKNKALEIINESENVIEALFYFAELNHKEMSKVNPCFISDMKKYHPKVFQRIYDNGDLRNMEITYTILKKGINEGVFTKEINIDVANRFIHHTFDFVQIAENEINCHQIEIWRSVHLPYLKGISTEKGNQQISALLMKHRNKIT